MEEILHHLGWYIQAKSCIYSDFWVVKLVQDFIQPCKTSGQAGVGQCLHETYCISKRKGPHIFLQNEKDRQTRMPN